LRTADKGATWDQANNGLVGNTINDIVVNNGKTMAVGSGFFISTNYGDTWEYRNTGMAVFRANCFGDFHDRLICGLNDHIAYSDDRGHSWNSINLPYSLNSYCIEKNDSLIFLGTSNGFFISSDSGLSWSPRNTGLYHPSIISLLKTSEGLFAGTSEGGAYYSSDNGMHWTARNSGIETSYVSCFLPVENGLLAGTSGGGIYWSNNNGGTWTAMPTTGLPQWVWGLVNHHGQLFAATSIGLYSSADDGNTWSLTGNGLWEVGVRLLKSVDNALFLTNEAGFFVSLDNGLNWSAAAEGLQNHEIASLHRVDNKLIAGTSHNGVWMRPFSKI
jgi:photosystem II stability/assembly factor-like uncharacterized protein